MAGCYSVACRSVGVLLLMLSMQIGRNVAEQELKLIQILFRHGDRAPVKTFPTDEWKYAWPDGLGELTQVGMVEQYHLGQYLRTRYGQFLNDTYNHTTVYVRSTDVDRTLMSAYSNLAGFFPPEGKKIWDKDIKWQPIPVHTVPESEDYILSFDSTCPKYDKLYHQVMNSPEADEINEKYKSLYEFLNNKTGLNIKNFDDASGLYDTLLVEQSHNLTMPEWLNSSIYADLKLCSILSFAWLLKTHEMRRLHGGLLVGEIVKNIEKVTSTDTTKTTKAYIYSAHDTTVAMLLAALDVFDPQAPPYCSTVMVELLEDNGTLSVKILYRNETDRDPYELKLKGCTSPCPFYQFKELTKSVIPLDIKKECSFFMDDNIALISTIIGSVLVCVLLMLIVYAYTYYRKNSSNFRYINIQNDI